ncbi:hypothetical protein I5677_16695 [Mobilitalea sibirica]|uniref:Uncharacterized protein n=1 Tax=Mobilitalea sibirica TaxID=1462919 RepID=A0A8J7L3G2_9FIRM|nr:hypothetical protein [Mobilitalea sibirica]MBH1942533.1 hypothetical protein [Mobilitalea sibirica]
MSNFVFIKEEYFKMNSSFIEMLDPFDYVKQSQRQYLFIKVQYQNNNILVPLRKNLPYIDAKLFFPVPSQSKPRAGLDYRKMLIVNNLQHIETPQTQRLTNSQTNIIINNYNTIETAVLNYIQGYIKAAYKGRERIDNKYKYSTLHNFHAELGIHKENEVAITKAV